MGVKKVTKYVASDGTEFSGFVEAEIHENYNTNLAKLTGFFKNPKKQPQELIRDPKAAAELRGVLDSVLRYQGKHEKHPKLASAQKQKTVAKRSTTGKISGRNTKIVVAYNANGKEVKRFNSMTAAADSLGTHISSISQSCRGIAGKVGGYFWAYAGKKPTMKLSKRDQTAAALKIARSNGTAQANA